MLWEPDALAGSQEVTSMKIKPRSGGQRRENREQASLAAWSSCRTGPVLPALDFL